MSNSEEFDLRDFFPYLLNLAAEESSLDFQAYYKTRYGMLRMEWRVLFHLGRYGEMTATEMGQRAKLHKTKISRAVKALENRRFLTRHEMESDRRNELLQLSALGKAAYDDLHELAQKYNQSLADQFSKKEQAVLRSCLLKLAKL
ncbi:MAG: MarR family transcriptional regulator [Rhizobiaceae bacterium]|nr:MarR family transcriptional regulator [Rhizobiaceae bacterium]